MEHPARVEEEREGGTGPRGRDTGGRETPGSGGVGCRRYYQGSAWCGRLALRVRGLNLAKRVGVGAGNGASRKGGRGKGRGNGTPREGYGGERDPREWRCGLQKVLSG